MVNVVLYPNPACCNIYMYGLYHTFIYRLQEMNLIIITVEFQLQ